MINFEDVTKEILKEHNQNCPQITDHPYWILFIGGSGSRIVNVLPNLINHKPYTDKRCLNAKDPYGAKYQSSINKHEGTTLKHFWLLLVII